MFQPPDLRVLLRANAAFASATGLAAIGFTGPVARLLGVGQHRLVSITGVGLLLFAISLLVASAAPTARLIIAGRLISAADALWVVASAVVVGFAALPAEGNIIIGVIAVIVATFAALQLLAGSRVDDREDHQVVQVWIVLDGTVDDVWAVVTDHEAYGRLAPNLSKVIPTSPDGPDLTRRCWDVRGRHWDEQCVLWEQGVRFAVVVDTAAEDYPYPLDYLRGEWAVRPIGTDQTEVSIRFELRPAPGLSGSAFAAAMTAGARPILRQVSKGWQELVSGARPVAR